MITEAIMSEFWIKLTEILLIIYNMALLDHNSLINISKQFHDYKYTGSKLNYLSFSSTCVQIILRYFTDLLLYNGSVGYTVPFTGVRLQSKTARWLQ